MPNKKKISRKKFKNLHDQNQKNAIKEDRIFTKDKYDEQAIEHNHALHRMKVIGTYVYGLFFIILPPVIISIWVYHLLLPLSWYWLSSSQLQIIQNGVFGVGGVGIGILHSYIGSQFFNSTKH